VRGGFCGFQTNFSWGASTYYLLENGQVEVMNKSLKTILQKTVSQTKFDWHLMLYPALWAYRTSLNTSIDFSPFQLVHGVELIIPIECEIISLRLTVNLLPDTFNLEEHLVHLESLDEKRRDASMTIEVNKRRVKVQYDNSIYPRQYTKGNLVLLYDQEKEPLGEGKFNPMWQGPYIVRRVLEKGAYELEYYEGNMLDESINGLYLKRYYA
jgi:hypothetical protein